MAYARVAVNVPTVSGQFDYHLPTDLEGMIGVGHLVTVPFGKQTVQGVVLELVPAPAIEATKPILDLLDTQPVLTPVQIELAKQLAETTLNPLAAMIDLMLPAGLSQQADTLYSIAKPQSTILDQQSSIIQSRIVKLLSERGPLRGRQIERHFKNVDWRKTADWLAHRGVLARRSILPPPSIRPKYIRTAQLAVPPETAESAMPDLGRTAATLQRRGTALRFLIREPEAVNVSWVYAESGCSLADLQELAERELITLSETEIWRDPLEKIGKRGLNFQEPGDDELLLTASQVAAWQVISSSFADSLTRPILLHGVTGSGKTELYLRATQEAIRRGRQAIILVPEIALTPQTVHRFLVRFPGQVGLIHSRLSPGERYDTWRRARQGLLKVIIGPRSALYSPLPDVGLIVADECHDSSYYQSEQPFYHAIRAAERYADLCGAVCILGSATPSIEQRYQAQAGGSIRLELPERIARFETADPGSGLPPVSIVDMREELKSGNRGIFSQPLVDALAATLERGEQAILFLNRRGTATYVFCRECGYTLKCPQCDTPLTFHIQVPRVELLCHRCGYTRRMPAACLQCGSKHIRQYGLGSEKVESEVQELFPQARTLRWDWETTRQKDAHEIILAHFAAHRADVLVGTQMLAKGLDLPLVTLVGIVLADVGLSLPDPFAAERVFQVLTQVAGRAGRSSRGGRVIMQTFQPEHYAIQHASRHDYAGFYAEELVNRQRLGYPPFAKLVRLEYRHRDATRAESAAMEMSEKIKQWLAAGNRRQTTVIGPAPCFFAKLGGLYRWQIVLRGPQPESLLLGKRLDGDALSLSKGWRVEVGPVSLL